MLRLFTAKTFLLLILSITAGSVDTIGFLGLSGLFSAHITGNIVIVGAHFVTGKFSQTSPLLAVPVFMLVLGLVSVAAGRIEKAGIPVLAPLLILQSLLLILSWVLAIWLGPFANIEGAMAVLTGMLLVGAMAVQSAAVKLAIKGAPSTVAMTNNVTQLSLDLALLAHKRQASEVETIAAKQQVKLTSSSLFGFIIGCGLGAVLQVLFDLNALLLPIVMAFFCIFVALKIQNGTD